MDAEKQHVTIGPKDESKVQHIMIWIHGLDELPSKHFKIFQSEVFKNFKIILPVAPTRFVTVLKKQAPSWFDIKFRNEQSFTCPFDEAFSSAEVHDSYEKVLKPLIHKCREDLAKLNNPNSKLIVGGFSQGCGMSLHCFYNQPEKVDAAIGASGYLFPFTPFTQTNRFHRVIYGENDNLRPWDYVKVTYQGKIGKENIVMLPETKHEVNAKSAEQIRKAVAEVVASKGKL